MKFFDLARMTVASTGTGNITLGTAVTGLLTFDLAGCSTTSSGQVIRYAINDNTNSEIGQATYISSSLLLSGRSPEASTNGGATIGVSNAAQVFITPSAADWQSYVSVVVWSSAMALTSSEAAQASNNISAVSYSTAQTLGSSQYAPALSNLTAVSYSSQATALSSTQFDQALTNITAVSYSSQATALTSTQYSQALANITAVSYSSRATALTSAQSAQALTNITAVSYSSLATALTSPQQAQAKSNLGINLSTVLYSSNNLSDLNSATAALANLGLLSNNVVGTTAFCFNNNLGALNFGDTVAGGDLLTTDTGHSVGASLTGTWLCLGSLTGGGTNSTVFARIA